MNGLKVLSTGYYAPQKVLDNFDLEQMVETSMSGLFLGQE